MLVRIAKSLASPTLRYRIRVSLRRLRPHVRPEPESDRIVPFVCNICSASTSAPHRLLLSDNASCPRCGSSTRFRAVIHGLSLGLFGDSRRLDDFPTNKRVCGAGMTDWIGYAYRLARKFDYTNTFYHTAPHLDIADDQGLQPDRYDFVLSSDVMEHVRSPVTQAFTNVRKILKPGGVFVVTVPCSAEGETIEHFPGLYDYAVVPFNGAQLLVNRSADGCYQVYDRLVFHGGPGDALELRCFSIAGLARELQAAGFTDIDILDAYPRFGFLHADPPDGVIAIARKP